MNILTIDLGSYSVKFLETRLDKKSLVLEGHNEFIIPISNNNEELLVNQHNAIKSYLERSNFDGRIIFQYPEQLITSRYLTLPVTSRKKVEQMIPFQLEENLPFPITHAHYTSELHKTQNGTIAIINITHENVFKNWFESLKFNEILPTILTTELSLVQNFIDAKNINEPSCVLDIGHHTTKAYFINEKRIVSNHVSYLAGESINEVIAQTYNVSDADAVTYKHKNCFMLTTSQYSDVATDQLEFATIMKKTFAPLILDMKKWMLGFRVQCINPIHKVYLAGGTANISNLSNFLTEELSTPVEKIRLFDSKGHESFDLTPKEQMTFFLTGIMAKTHLTKSPVTNLLTGHFSNSFVGSFPLYSTAFIFTRVTIVAILIILGLSIERLFISNEIEKISKKTYSEIKKPALNIPKPQQRNLKKQPNKILKYIVKNNTKLKKEVLEIKAIQKNNPINEMLKIGQFVSNDDKLRLETYKQTGKKISSKISSSLLQKLEQIDSQLNTLKLHKLEKSINKTKKIINIDFELK